MYESSFDRTMPSVSMGAGTTARAVMMQVYMWMGAGLLITALVAAYTIGSGAIENLSGGVVIAAFVVQLGLVFGLSFMINRISASMAAGLFLLYSAVTGITISLIVYAYTPGSVAAAFGSTAALFGAMSIVGATTKIDLSRFGAFFLMALIGLLIAIVVNIFLASSALNFAISVFGVLLFTGLTAYDTQRIGRMAAQIGNSGDRSLITRVAIIGALSLYLDFINLFIYLLRLLGDRR